MPKKSPGNRFIAAAVQRPPCILDVEAGVRRAVETILEAADSGARLVVFPETWLPNYPYWHPFPSELVAFSELYRQLFENSIAVPGPEVEQIGAAAAKVDVDGLSTDEAAARWIEENKDVWGKWIPACAS